MNAIFVQSFQFYMFPYYLPHVVISLTYLQLYFPLEPLGIIAVDYSGLLFISWTHGFRKKTHTEQLKGMFQASTGSPTMNCHRQLRTKYEMHEFSYKLLPVNTHDSTYFKKKLLQLDHGGIVTVEQQGSLFQKKWKCSSCNIVIPITISSLPGRQPIATQLSLKRQRTEQSWPSVWKTPPSVQF